MFDLGSAELPIGTVFTIINNQSGMTTGFFNGLPNGAGFSSGLNDYAINYNVGLGDNDVQITVVPEADPAAALAVGLLLAAGLRRVRLRRG